MTYCSECGSPLAQDNLRCPACHADNRQHPKLLVACFVHCGPRLLWMRRALPPQKGFWAIPAGFMESGESMAEAAARETREETGIVLSPEKLSLFMMGTISFISEVYVAFHASVPDTLCYPGDEALEAQFFTRDELPWNDIAYPQANHSILAAYDCIERGQFPLFHCEMTADKNDLTPISTLPLTPSSS